MNNAVVAQWPEITAGDASLMLPEQPLDSETASGMLSLCGGHPRLLREIFDRYAPERGFDGAGCRGLLEY